MNCPFNLNKKIEIYTQICINLFFQNKKASTVKGMGRKLNIIINNDTIFHPISSGKIATNQNEKGKNPDFNLTC